MNLAEKKPAKPEIAVQEAMERRNARTTRRPRGIPEKLTACPKNPNAVVPLVVTSLPVNTADLPTRRPMLKSVPAKTIKPATPSAKNLRGAVVLRIRIRFEPFKRNSPDWTA